MKHHAVHPSAAPAPAERPRISKDEFSALPEPVRRYIMFIETDCDPSGTIRSEMHLRDQVEALELRVQELQAALKRTDEHMRAFADLHPEERTSETEAIIWCNQELRR